MNPLIKSHLADVAALCRRYDVLQLEVFGSATRDDFSDATSDIDFVVRFNNSRTPGYADRYFEFAEALQALFGRRVDLVTERSLRNPLFVRAIEPERTILYAA